MKSLYARLVLWLIRPALEIVLQPSDRLTNSQKAAIASALCRLAAEGTLPGQLSVTRAALVEELEALNRITSA